MTAEGRITGFTGVKKLGLMVHIQKYGIEGPVFTLFGIEGKHSAFLAHSSTEIQSKMSKRIYSIFDRVRIRMEVSTVNDYDEELVLALIDDEL